MGSTQMKVNIVAFPTDEHIVYTAAAGKMAYSHDSFLELVGYFRGRQLEAREFLVKIIKLEHESVLEHIEFMFDIEQISRWATHELVRHRIGSFTQKSLRKKRNLTKYDFVINPVLNEEEQNLKRARYARAIEEYYSDLEHGMSVDDARADLPGAVASEIVWSVNLRSLRNFLSLRGAPKAYWEIRWLATIIMSLFRTYKMDFLIKDLKVYEGMEEKR